MGAVIENSTINGKPNQDVFSAALLELAEKDRNIVVVTSDSRGSGKLVAYGQKLPEQIVEIGIAEQNLGGVAAGLASAGKKNIRGIPGLFFNSKGPGADQK